MENKGILSKGKKINGYCIRNFIKSYNEGKSESYLVTNNEGEKYILKIFSGSKGRMPIEYKKCGLFQEPLGPFAQVVDSGDFVINGVNYHYLIRSTFEGAKIGSLIKQGKRFSWSEAKYVVSQILHGLQHLHKQKTPIVHNNITPNTVLIDKSGGWEKVCLLGTSKLSYSTENAHKNLLDKMDKFFRAPETQLGKLDVRSDIYSVGALLYTMLFGPEYRNIALSPVASLDDGELAYSIRLVTEPISFNFIDLSPDKKNCLSKMMAVDPDKRYQCVEDALEELLGKKNKASKTEELEVSKKKNSITKTKSNVIRKAKSAASSNKGGFADVAGMDELKEMLRNRVLFVMQNPDIAKEYRLSIPNGILLYGPPGCGKTYIAEKFAEEAKINFVSVKASDLGSSYIHATQNNIAKMFADAVRKAPTILFLDELDALVPSRVDMQSEHMAGEVNEFLTQMNNCSEKGVFVIGATNCPDKIDNAILRTGRIDRMIYVPMPDKQARKEIFKMELKGRKHEVDIDCDLLAENTKGYVASDISYIVKECAFESAIKSCPISQQMILDTIKITRRSVSQEQLAMYEEKRGQFEHKSAKTRVKIGFKV